MDGWILHLLCEDTFWPHTCSALAGALTPLTKSDFNSPTAPLGSNIGVIQSDMFDDRRRANPTVLLSPLLIFTSMIVPRTVLGRNQKQP